MNSLLSSYNNTSENKIYVGAEHQCMPRDMSDFLWSKEWAWPPKRTLMTHYVHPPKPNFPPNSTKNHILQFIIFHNFLIQQC